MTEIAIPQRFVSLIANLYRSAEDQLKTNVLTLPEPNLRYCKINKKKWKIEISKNTFLNKKSKKYISIIM